MLAFSACFCLVCKKKCFMYMCVCVHTYKYIACDGMIEYNGYCI